MLARKTAYLAAPDPAVPTRLGEPRSTWQHVLQKQRVRPKSRSWLRPAAPGRPATEDLAGLDDLALLSLVQSLPLASQWRAAACELLVTRYQGLVRSCVRPYRGSPVPTEDLMQVGYFGLLKAISHFDPAAGASLGAYARPCISGELKRYFRDKRWALHVDRPVQELILQVRDATGPLAQQLGRTPADSDLARHLGVSGDKLRQARQAQLAFQPSSLDAPQADQVPRSPWPTPSGRRIPGSTTCSACTPSPPTGASCPRASSRS